MSVKIYDYLTSGDYTYDTSKIDVSGGLASLKIIPDYTDLLGYWEFEDDYQDSSGQANHGSPAGNPTFETGKVGDCVNLDGIGDWVTLGDSFSLNVMAISFWFKSTGINQYLFSGGDAWDGYIYMQAGGTTGLWASGNIQTLVFTASLVNWNHVVMVSTGTTHLAYLNGVLVDSTASTLDLFTGDYNVRMGARGDNGSSPFNGLIDEVAIYNRILDLTEIQDIYNSGNGRRLNKYSIDKPTIEPTVLFGPVSVTSWDAFLETLGGGNQGSIGYNLYKVDKVNKYYWNGSAWVTGGSSSIYNTVSTINTNIGSFDASPDKIGFIAYLISDGTQVVQLDENQITYSAGIPPLINAGSNKSCNQSQTISPFSDCSFSDPDGLVIKIEYKIDGEVDVWTEIPQGAFGSLLEAVQAWTYMFNNLGVITARLQATDDTSGGGFTSDDSLTVTVSKYTKTVDIKDADTDEHLSLVSFDPGDGTGVSLQNSPFSYDWGYGNFDITMEKSLYNSKSQTINIVDESNLELTMTQISVLNHCKGVIGLLTESDTIAVTTWLEKNGERQTTPTSCEIWLYDNNNNLKYHPVVNSSPETSGVFHFNLSPSLLADDQVYHMNIQIIDSGVTYNSTNESGQIKRDKNFPEDEVYIDVDNGEIGTAYPIGTPSRPVNNFADAKTIADANFLKAFHVVGSLNISISQDIDGLSFHNNDSIDNKVILNGSNTFQTVFKCITVEGTLNGKVTMEECIINSLINFSGYMKDCLLASNIILSGSDVVHLIDCRSAVPGTSTPEIDMGGSGRGLGIRAYAGGIKIINLTGVENISLDFISGQAQIDTTCTNGTIVIRGNCTVTDNSGNGCTIINQSIYSLLTRTLGLSQENYRIFSPTYNDSNNLLSGVIKIYASKTDTDNDINSIASYTMTATYDVNGKMSTYKVTKD